MIFKKKAKKRQFFFTKQAHENGITKTLLIVDGWDIDVDDDYVNSLDSKINDVKNKIGLSNDNSDDNNNESNFSFIDKSNIRDHDLTLRLKALGKRQVKKVGFIEVVSYIFIFIFNWEMINALKRVTFIVYH